ncbi:OLC1v1032209C1 [Oldenlandia corymbosa var. corymbosa]|uniref:OLC1v1032209C1 n=1 Tax=Oldenlandia corymbosa var. corymbosa TaxID=529605 RepID=A0AAV1CN51_OLDCO|nr:OLC1v1032209C1 [Oldenlandia corymbosa var. corymbosa]
MAIQVQSDIRSAILFATAFHHNRHHHHSHRPSMSCSLIFRRLSLPCRSLFSVKVRSFSALTEKSSSTTDADEKKLPTKPSICTADELHYVTAKNSKWRLALWRYIPPPQAPKRNHPLLLLSGVGTNAIGYDLAPGSSFARYMCAQGFDTWILEVRGAGLSTEEMDSKDIEKSAHAISDKMEEAAENATDGLCSVHEQSTDGQKSLVESGAAMANEDSMGLATAWDESKLVEKLTDTFMSLSERLSGFLNERQSSIMSAKLFDQLSKLFEDSFLFERFNEVKGKLLSLLETRQNSSVALQIRELSQKLVNIVEEGQRSVSPQLYDMQERLAATVEDFQKQLELIIKYDWDFDHYLEEDVPAAMEYIRSQCGPADGKLLATGHSMGGILLYAMLSRCGAEGRESPFAAIVTLASSLDYTSSNSTLKLLLPLADPAQVLNVPVVPLGALLSAAYPLSSSPPYVLSWLVDHISAQDMMHPELLKKLVLNNFCTIPAKLLLQLTTAFREGGLRDRSGTFLYKDHIHKSNVPVLALAGDRDLICPPEAVYETVKLLPEALVTYKVLGKDEGPHYAHYDLVGGRLAVEEVYPCIVEFFSRHDQV